MKKINFSKINLKNLLIILATIAFILGITTTFIIFYNPSISVNANKNSSLFAITKNSTSTGTANQQNNSTTTNNSSNSTTNNNTSSTVISDQYSSSYSSPFPLQWQEGQSTMVITGASIQQNKLQFTISIQMGNQSECIPMNMRLIVNESGNTENPNEQQFSFPDTNSCNGTANATYNNQTISFNILSTMSAPYLISTGGTSNIFFEIATTTDNGVSITLPTTTG